MQARSTARPHSPLSRLEHALIVVVLGIAAAVAVPEYLDLRQEAKEDSARSRLTQATKSLERQHASAGTYAGAAVPAGVHLRRVARGSYCAETAAGGRAWHVVRGSGPRRGAC
jgi:Tfp pilus assembly protein PilE